MKKLFFSLIISLLAVMFSGCDGNISPTTEIDRSAILVGLGSLDSEEEFAELNATLTQLGYSTTDDEDPSAVIIISAPGVSANFVDGKPYIQISDWGADTIANSFSNIGPTGTVPVQITLIDDHPILDGVDSTWTTNGFWRYGYEDDYIGWATEPDQSLANIATDTENHNGGLAMNSAEDQLYIGWSIYGSLATSNDIKILDNAILYMTGN